MRLLLIIPLLISVSAYSQNDGTVTIKEYIDMNIEWSQKMNILRDEHQKEVNRIKEENIKNAYASMNIRLDGMNEFRQTLNDSNKTFVTWTSLVYLVFGLAGLVFGYSNYKKNKEAPKSSGAVIRSGDNVEVKK